MMAILKHWIRVFCLFCLALHFHHSLCVAWLFVSIPIFLFTIFLYYLLYVLFFYQLFVSNVIQLIFFLSFLILSCPSHNPFFLNLTIFCWLFIFGSKILEFWTIVNLSQASYHEYKIFISYNQNFFSDQYFLGFRTVGSWLALMS